MILSALGVRPGVLFGSEPRIKSVERLLWLPLFGGVITAADHCSLFGLSLVRLAPAGLAYHPGGGRRDAVMAASPTEHLPSETSISRPG